MCGLNRGGRGEIRIAIQPTDPNYSVHTACLEDLYGPVGMCTDRIMSQHNEPAQQSHVWIHVTGSACTCVYIYIYICVTEYKCGWLCVMYYMYMCAAAYIAVCIDR